MGFAGDGHGPCPALAIRSGEEVDGVTWIPLPLIAGTRPRLGPQGEQGCCARRKQGGGRWRVRYRTDGFRGGWAWPLSRVSHPRRGMAQLEKVHDPTTPWCTTETVNLRCRDGRLRPCRGDGRRQRGVQIAPVACACRGDPGFPHFCSSHRVPGGAKGRMVTVTHRVRGALLCGRTASAPKAGLDGAELSLAGRR